MDLHFTEGIAKIQPEGIVQYSKTFRIIGLACLDVIALAEFIDYWQGKITLENQIP